MGKLLDALLRTRGLKSDEELLNPSDQWLAKLCRDYKHSISGSRDTVYLTEYDVPLAEFAGRALTKKDITLYGWYPFEWRIETTIKSDGIGYRICTALSKPREVPDWLPENIKTWLSHELDYLYELNVITAAVLEARYIFTNETAPELLDPSKNVRFEQELILADTRKIRYHGTRVLMVDGTTKYMFARNRNSYAFYCAEPVP